jgi:hypothetical protein
MLKTILKIGSLSFVAAALAAAPAQLLAQSTNTHGTDKKAPAATTDTATKKKAAHPFHGKLAAVDKVAKTIKVGETTYQVTSATKITKDGKPATLEQGVVGEPVSGYVEPTADGKMAAKSLMFGAKPAKH